MTSRLLISLSVLLIAAQRLCAQLAPAEDFFNGGAQLYISNNIPSALERVEMGLKTYPDDMKLKKLEELLKQKNQQQQQQQQQQNQSQQQKSDDQKNQQQQNQQQKSSEDQKKQDEQKKDQSDPKKDADQKQPEQKKDASDKSKDQQPEQQPGQPVKPGEMTPEEAKRLLDAQKGDEQLLQMKPQDKPRDPSRPVKDW
jgi:Ca-activated chloride channel family protein